MPHASAQTPVLNEQDQERWVTMPSADITSRVPGERSRWEEGSLSPSPPTGHTPPPTLPSFAHPQLSDFGPVTPSCVPVS